MNIWLWLVIALAVRIYKIGLIKCIATDGVAYIGVAKDWLTGTGFHPNWPPLYPWFVSLLMRLGIEPELCGQLISCLFGVGTVGLVYLVTRSVSTPRIAQTAMIFSVFHPYLVRYSSEVLTDSLFMFLLTAVVFCGWQLIHPVRSRTRPPHIRKDLSNVTNASATSNGVHNKRLVFALLTGFLAGLSYLTKPEGLFLLVIISLWHRRWRQVLCMWIVFLIVSFPYIYAIHEKTGEWMISQKQNIVFSVALQEEGLASEFLNISPWKYAKGNPGAFFLKVGRGLWRLLGRIPDAYHPVLFLFLIIGLVTGISPVRSRTRTHPIRNVIFKGTSASATSNGVSDKRFLFYIITFLIPFFIGYAIFHPGRRYLVGWVPLTLFLSAYGVRNLWILVLISVLIMLPKTLEPIRVGGIKWKEAGLWIKNNSSGRPRIMSRNNRVAFYADGKDAPQTEADYIVTEEDISSLKKIHCTPKGINIYAGS